MRLRFLRLLRPLLEQQSSIVVLRSLFCSLLLFDGNEQFSGIFYEVLQLHSFLFRPLLRQEQLLRTSLLQLLAYGMVLLSDPSAATDRHHQLPPVLG